MSKLVAVALGGAAGTIGRYLIAVLSERCTRANFPYETLSANLIGCLLIGLLWGCFERVPLSNEFRLFLFTGFLGGFTTFSTFARECIQFIKAGEVMHAVVYLLVSNVFGLALVAAGFFISTRLLSAERLF